jgi:hypothetical protein
MGSETHDSNSTVEAEVGAGPAAPTNAADAEDGKPNPATAAFHRLTGDLEELKEYAGHYVAAKIDGFRRTVRNLGLYAALGVLGLIVGGAVLATAAGLIIVGLAEGLGRLFGYRYWLGDIVAGVVVLGAIAASVWFMMNKLTGSWHAQTVKKYEERKRSQRERFGHDVTARAAQGGTEGREKAKRG